MVQSRLRGSSAWIIDLGTGTGLSAPRPTSDRLRWSRSHAVAEGERSTRFQPRLLSTQRGFPTLMARGMTTRHHLELQEHPVYNPGVPSQYRLHAFAQPSVDHPPLTLETFEQRAPGPKEVEVKLRALSLNYRDLMIIRGHYNPKLNLPVTPLSDGAGEVTAVGADVQNFAPGDRVLTNFASSWQDGPFDASHLKHTLGTPGPGVATQYQYLSEGALLKIPEQLSFADAATLPIAGLTAYSALVTEGQARPGQTVLTLGTGGVSLFVLAIAQRLGLRVAITSSSDEKLARCKELGAAFTVNYRNEPAWGKAVAAWAGAGVDIVVETGGAQTLCQSIRSTRAGGRLSILGALTGVKGEIDLAPIMMRRISLHGVMVDSKAKLSELLALWSGNELDPPLKAPIAIRFSFEKLNEALCALAQGEHMGKVVVELS